MLTAILLLLKPLYCAKPVEFLSVNKTDDGAPEGVDVKETVYDPAAILLQLTVALPAEDETFPVVPSIVAIIHGLYSVSKSVPPYVTVPVNAGLAFGANKFNAFCVKVEIGLLASDVLLTLPRPTIAAVMPLTVPENVGLAFVAYIDDAVALVKYDPKVVLKLDDVM